jgi:AcrR family transcriptional regulator
MPRQYSMGKRADLKAETRTRIITAAVDLYRERGTSGGSIRAIARRADVAVATVTNHFPRADDLSAAVAEQVLDELRMPGPDLFDGLEQMSERIAILARELAAFFDRSESWWRLYDRDPALGASWSGAERRYFAKLDRLVRLALGPLAEDELAVAVATAVIGPPVFVALRGRGLSSDDAAEISTQLVVPWLEARRR